MRLSPLFPTNVKKRPQNFVNFSFDLFATLVQNLKAIPTARPKLLNLNREYPSLAFLVKSLQKCFYDNFSY